MTNNKKAQNEWQFDGGWSIYTSLTKKKLGKNWGKKESRKDKQIDLFLCLQIFPSLSLCYVNVLLSSFNFFSSISSLFLFASSSSLVVFAGRLFIHRLAHLGDILLRLERLEQDVKQQEGPVDVHDLQGHQRQIHLPVLRAVGDVPQL